MKLESISEDAKTIITSEPGAKHIQVWWCDLSAGKLSRGPVLSMKHPPFVSECRNISNGEDSIVVLSVSVSGVAYLWKLKFLSEGKVSPTKVTVKVNNVESAEESHGSAKKNRISVISSTIQGLGDNEVSVLVTHGSMDLPQHTVLNIGYPAKEDVNIALEKEGLTNLSFCHSFPYSPVPHSLTGKYNVYTLSQVPTRSNKQLLRLKVRKAKRRELHLISTVRQLEMSVMSVRIVFEPLLGVLEFPLMDYNSPTLPSKICLEQIA